MSTGKYKLMNGVVVEMTQAEIDEQTKPESEIFNEAMTDLRTKRNRFLIESDWTQSPDSPLTDSKKTEWATYRTNLRNLTNGLTTVEQVNGVTWPTQPS